LKFKKYDLAIHFGGSVCQALRSNRLIDIERIHDGRVITLGGVVLVVCYFD
jgi:hypothetical protein